MSVAVASRPVALRCGLPRPGTEAAESAESAEVLSRGQGPSVSSVPLRASGCAAEAVVSARAAHLGLEVLGGDAKRLVLDGPCVSLCVSVGSLWKFHCKSLEVPKTPRKGFWRELSAIIEG